MSCRSAPASYWIAAAARSPRCSLPSASASADRWPADTSTSPGSTRRPRRDRLAPRSPTSAGPARSTATAPAPETNGELAAPWDTRCTARALPVRPALRLLYGGMAQIVTTGVRVLPAKALCSASATQARPLHLPLAAWDGRGAPARALAQGSGASKAR